MKRNKNSVLNQNFEEPQIEEVIETEPMNVEEALLSPEPEEIELKEDLSPELEEIKILDKDLTPEEISDLYNEGAIDGAVDGAIESEEEVKSRTIESLSYKELRFFQRTGQMPK